LIPQLAPTELAAWRADSTRPAPVIVDVREPWEYALCRIEDSVHVPLGELSARLSELPRDRDVVLVCHHGSRSQHAALLLARNGFNGVHNLRGGIEGWALDVDPSVSRY
jgi:rhodanese-related sulfurtransferase